MSYECFSILCNAFLLKSVISSHNSCDYCNIINACNFLLTLNELINNNNKNNNNEPCGAVWGGVIVNFTFLTLMESVAFF